MQITNKIEKILNSDKTAYEIAKKSGVSEQLIGKYRNKKLKIENMTIKNAEKLINAKYD